MGDAPLRIRMITQNFPSPRYPDRGAFVHRLVRQWIDLGHRVDVVAPDTVADRLRSLRRTVRPVEEVSGSDVRPTYFSVGNSSRGLVHRFRITRRNFVRATRRAGRTLPLPDVAYGKFLFRGGEAALDLASHTGVPAFADLGESWSFLDLERRSRTDATEIMSGLTGVICVSKRLQDEAIALGVPSERTLLAPNDVDLDRFRRHDRAEARERLGLPPDRCIVAFSGHFVERKGPLRVAAAISRLDAHVGAIFLGRGHQAPTGEEVLYSGSVPNDEMPIWLSAADIFVLPTLAEGHCNAINEAMACGLPIVTSDIDDVRSQVDPSFALLVDPGSVDAISDAVDRLYRDETLRERMGRSAYESMRVPGVWSRAEKILDFIREKAAP